MSDDHADTKVMVLNLIVLSLDYSFVVLCFVLNRAMGLLNRVE